MYLFVFFHNLIYITGEHFYIHANSDLFAGGVVSVPVVEHRGVAVAQPLPGLPVDDKPILKWHRDRRGEPCSLT